MPGRVVAPVRYIRDLSLRVAGGPARMRVVLTLAAVLGLSGADTGTISSTTGNLEQAFGVGNTQIGLLLTVVGLTGALFTIPAGVLTDRTRRTRLLAGSIVVWAAATVVSGAAASYLWLLLARVGLGAATATAGPALASLTGDYFPASDRGRMYGLILGGDLVGSGFGYLVSGDLSSLTTWRVAFWWLAIPSLALAWVVWRMPEPARGGSSRIEVGQEKIREQRDTGPGRREQAGQEAGERDGAERPDLAERAVRRAEVEPQRELVLHEDPQYVFGGPGSPAGVGAGSGGGQTGNPTGLEYTFLVFLIPLIAAGLLALAALRTYPRDVATASASVRAVDGARQDEEPGGRRAA